MSRFGEKLMAALEQGSQGTAQHLRRREAEAGSVVKMFEALRWLCVERPMDWRRPGTYREAELRRDVRERLRAWLAIDAFAHMKALLGHEAEVAEMQRLEAERSRREQAKLKRHLLDRRDGWLVEAMRARTAAAQAKAQRKAARPHQERAAQCQESFLACVAKLREMA